MPCKSAYGKSYRGINKAKLANLKAKYRVENSHVWRDHHFRKYYGITLIQYNQMLEQQKGVCAICLLPESSKSERYKRLCVDHDHATGKVRALLCNKCNRALGLLGEDFEATLRLAKYVHEHKNII